MKELIITSKRNGYVIFKVKSKATSKKALRRHLDRLDNTHGGYLHHSFMVDGTETLIFNIPFTGNN